MDTKMMRIVFYQGIKTEYCHAKPHEAKQIRHFVEANSRTDKTDSFRWFLCFLRNHHNGKPLLTAGMGLHDTDGIPTSRMREILDLPLLGRPAKTPTLPPKKIPLRKL